MTDHPIDTEALRRLADRATPEVGQESGAWQTDGYAEYIVVDCEQDSDGDYDHIAEAANERLGAFIAAANPDAIRALLDLLAAAEHRATRAEAQSGIRGRAVVMYRERARKAEARIKAVRAIHRDLYESMSGVPYCDECDRAWPCPTIRALESVPPPRA